MKTSLQSYLIPFFTALLVVVIGSFSTYAQEENEQAWEYQKYLVTVWIAPDGSPELETMVDELGNRLINQARIVDPVSWNLEFQRAPTPWDRRMQSQLETISGGALCDREDIAPRDKLIIVRIRKVNSSYEVSARELDIYTRQWGAVISQMVDDRQRLHWAVYKTVSQAFMPLCRIHHVVNKSVDVRVRAAELARRIEFTEDGELINEANTDSPAWVKPNDILQPIVRRSDRLKRVSDKSIKPVEWTYLTIEDHQGSRLACHAFEARRASLEGRSGYLIKKLALVIRPPKRSTRIKLVSKEENKPLAGYQIWEKNLDNLEEDAVLIGQSDWRGIFDVEPNEKNLRVLLIKNGSRGLARLPVIPGLYTEKSAEMPDDEARLYAEGVINGLQKELLDTVARREVYVVQIKKLIEENNPQEAEDLYKKLYELPNATNFGAKLTSYENDLRSQAKSDRERTKISGMFDKVREQSDKHLQTSQVQQIMQYVEDLKQGKPVVFRDDIDNIDGSNLQDESQEVEDPQ